MGVMNERLAVAVGALVLLAGLGLTGLANAQEVIPDFYKAPGVDPNRGYVNQSFAEHIDPFTGALQLHYVDIHLPGNGGFDLSVVRSYNSSGVNFLNPATYQGIAGVGWTIHFGRVLKKDLSVCGPGAISVANNPVLELPDGSRQLLAYTGTAPLALTAQRWRADCAAGGGLLVYSPEGTRYDMTQWVNVSAGSTQYAWYTTRITDRNGNYATVNYAAANSPEITSVTTSDSRSIGFAYTDSGTDARRVTSITAAGQTYNYGYTAISGVANRYQLTAVTRPGGTSWRYAYNDNLGTTAGSYLMKSLEHPEGGAISYTYDNVYFDTQANPNSLSMVVKSKAMSPGGSWSFSYTPGAPNVFDTTTVTSPDGTTTYRHLGPNYSSSGSVWMVGLLMSKQIGSAQSESYTWGKQRISPQNNMRPGAFVLKVDTGEVNAPVLTQRSIARNGASHTTTFGSFDVYGNPGTITESGPNGGSRSTTVSYNLNTAKWIIRQVKDESVSGGVSITRTIDSSGNVLSVNRDGVQTDRSYDTEGNVSSTTFPRSLTHTYSSYYRGIARTEQQREGVTINRAVSDAGNITSETNGEGNTTSYGYDGLNRLTAIKPAIGSDTVVSYGTSSKAATRGALTETTNYDGFGRPSSVVLGGISRSYQHDSFGRMTFASNPGAKAGEGTSYSYDILSRVTRVGNADGTSVNTSYGAGTKTVTNERQKATTYRYRSYGNPGYQVMVGVDAAVAAASVSITLTGRDQLDSLTQAGVTRRYGYNGAGYLTSVVNPETGTTTFGRDAAGNMTSRAVGASGTTSYGYDQQNRLTSVTYPGSTPAVTKTYTRTNKLKTVSTSVANRSYVYDANDNLTSETLTVSGNTFTTGYAYNGLDQLSSISYPISGRVVNYSPNALGRPTQVSGFATAVDYAPSGQLQRIAYANGTESVYGQNSRLWPSSFITRRGTGTWMNSQYGYDGAGNLTGVTDSSDAGNNRTYGYDDIDRLVTANGPWGGGSMAYDGAGNLTSQTLGSFSLSSQYTSNRLSNVSGAKSGSIGYDAYGNVVTAPGADYRYDGAPNLTCVNCTSGANTVQYVYDGLNRRVSTTKGGERVFEIYSSNGNLLLEYVAKLGGKRTEYIYLGNKRIAQVDVINGATAVALTARENPVAATRQVNLDAIVTGTSTTLTGSVVFKDGGTPLGTVPLIGSTASIGTTFSTPGVRSITAAYSGDASNSASESAALSLTMSLS